MDRWKNLIAESKKNLPYSNWYVACFIEEERKANSFLRLIRAGGGRALFMKPGYNHATSADSIRERDCGAFTLAIHTKETKASAEQFAKLKQIKSYPSLLIGDHLLYSMPISKPILPPIKYYTRSVKDRCRELSTVKNRSRELSSTSFSFFTLKKTNLFVW